MTDTMYKRNIYTILSNRPLTDAVYEMKLEGDTSYISAPGQFVNIEIPGKFLRRPISICDYDQRSITLIYKVVGEGTAAMSGMRAGDTLDMLTGLGNGFRLEEGVRRPLLVGGGVGVPPMFNLARRLIGTGLPVTAVLGFNTASEVFYADRFEALGAKTVVATADGSLGVKGFVTDAISSAVGEYDYVYACGPMPMLRALGGMVRTPGQFSFEERMGCGFGGCMGCTCKTKGGNKRICREGPVLDLNDIIW